MPALISIPERIKKARAQGIALAVVAVVIVLGYFAFRMIWGLVMLGYVDSAIYRMRVLSTAEAQFAKMHSELVIRAVFRSFEATLER